MLSMARSGASSPRPPPTDRRPGRDVRDRLPQGHDHLPSRLPAQRPAGDAHDRPLRVEGRDPLLMARERCVEARKAIAGPVSSQEKQREKPGRPGQDASKSSAEKLAGRSQDGREHASMRRASSTGTSCRCSAIG